MKDRIREIRKSEGMTVSEFANRLNVGKSAISLIENGHRNANIRMVKTICKEFNINEIWLTTGEGEMHLPISEDREIATISGNIFNESNPKRLALYKWVNEMDDDEIEIIYQVLYKLMRINDSD